MKSRDNKSALPYLYVRSQMRAGKLAGCTLKQKGKNGKPNKYWCCNQSGSCWPVWTHGSLDDYAR